MKLLDLRDDERIYYRHHKSGDLGWLVHDEKGQPAIRRNLPGKVNLIPFREAEWLPVREHAPYTRAQLVVVAFEADKALAGLLGYHELAKREWKGLTTEQRRRWIEEGPKSHPMRRRLYKAVMGVVGELGP